MNPDSAPRAANHPIRSVAYLQLGIAAICALVYAVPSVFFLAHPVTLVLIVSAWSFGLYLMMRYFQVATTAATARATLWIWVQSLAFNVGGFALLALIANLYPSSGLEPVLGATLLPAALGTVCGVLGIVAACFEPHR